MGIEDRDWYRDEIRKREAWPHPLSNRPPAGRSKHDSSVLWNATWCVLFVAATGGSFMTHGWWKARHSPEPIVKQAQPLPTVDPFKDDPTWHAGPRQALPFPDVPSTLETREVTKCIVGGHVSYVGESDCRGGSKVVVPIPSGPTYDQQQEALARADALADQNAAIDRRLMIEEWNRRQVAVNAGPSNLGKPSACGALDEAVRAYDAQARQPQSAGMQDWIKDQRRDARTRQAALHC